VGQQMYDDLDRHIKQTGALPTGEEQEGGPGPAAPTAVVGGVKA